MASGLTVIETISSQMSQLLQQLLPLAKMTSIELVVIP